MRYCHSYFSDKEGQFTDVMISADCTLQKEQKGFIQTSKKRRAWGHVAYNRLCPGFSGLFFYRAALILHSTLFCVSSVSACCKSQDMITIVCVIIQFTVSELMNYGFAGWDWGQVFHVLCATKRVYGWWKNSDSPEIILEEGFYWKRENKLTAFLSCHLTEWAAHQTLPGFCLRELWGLAQTVKEEVVCPWSLVVFTQQNNCTQGDYTHKTH